ncbi:MAG: dienelactone hydrolase family protein [Gaiellales bacterium]
MRRRRPPRRARPAPLLRGARPPARRTGRRGRRDRLLRPHGRGGEARRGLPVRRARAARHRGFGGRHSWLSTAGGHELAGAIGFYGSTGPRNGEPGPTQRTAEFRAPILALMGGADQAITADDIAAFHAALAEAGVDHHVVTYDGAPHSFFDRKQEQFADASADAWLRVFSFFETHMPA